MKKFIKKSGSFNVILLGVVFNPQKKQVLIIKNNNGWSFPESNVNSLERLENSLKDRIKDKIGYEIEILGPVFSSIHPEKKDKILIHYLCEITGGESGNSIEIKWVSPNELNKYFMSPLEPVLEDYVTSLI